MLISCHVCASDLLIGRCLDHIHPSGYRSFVFLQFAISLNFSSCLSNAIPFSQGLSYSAEALPASDEASDTTPALGTWGRSSLGPNDDVCDVESARGADVLHRVAKVIAGYGFGPEQFLGETGRYITVKLIKPEGFEHRAQVLCRQMLWGAENRMSVPADVLTVLQADNAGYANASAFVRLPENQAVKSIEASAQMVAEGRRIVRSAYRRLYCVDRKRH